MNINNKIAGVFIDEGVIDYLYLNILYNKRNIENLVKYDGIDKAGDLFTITFGNKIGYYKIIPDNRMAYDIDMKNGTYGITNKKYISLLLGKYIELNGYGVVVFNSDRAGHKAYKIKNGEACYQETLYNKIKVLGLIK